MSKVDISSEAVERAIAMAGLHGLHGTQATLRAQAERIKELEHFLAQEKKIAEKDHGVWCDNYAALDRRYKTARNDALREAAEVCTAVIKNYDVMKSDGKTFEPLKVKKAAKGMVSLARQDITALIEGATND